MNALLKQIKAFLQNIRAFSHIPHDGALHLANQLEICVFSKNWTLTAKTQSDPVFRRNHEMFPRSIGTLP